MARVGRYDELIARELDTLITKSPPYSLSSPKYGNPTLLDFVKGLIIATNVIDVINEYLPNGCHANWGQIIDNKNKDVMSHESDIVIYRGKPGCKMIHNKSMKFALVDKDRAKVVIQVKSSIDSVRDSDRTYCRDLLRFVPEVWYLAECCWAKKVSNLEKTLKKAGYSRFFYFYKRDEDARIHDVNYHSFLKFIQLIKKIK